MATLEPFGLGFEPVSLVAPDLASVDRLVANASAKQPDPPTDSHPGVSTNGDAPSLNGISPNGAAAPNGNGTALVAEPSEDVLDLIRETLAAKPVEVPVLGRHPKITGLDGEATPKIAAIIAYLAFHREVASQRLRDEFWPGSTSRQACDNAIGRARALLGVDGEGKPRLVTNRANHTYSVNGEVGLDWFRVEQLVQLAKGSPVADEAACLDAVCELIEGQVAADARPSNYAWLLREPTIYTLIETTLVDAAHRRGELALAAGDTSRARWAAEKGLSVVEGQEALYRLKMQAAAESGDGDGVRSAYREAQRAAESCGYDDEVQPETQVLFSKLMNGEGAFHRS